MTDEEFVALAKEKIVAMIKTAQDAGIHKIVFDWVETSLDDLPDVEFLEIFPATQVDLDQVPTIKFGLRASNALLSKNGLIHDWMFGQEEVDESIQYYVKRRRKSLKNEKAT